MGKLQKKIFVALLLATLLLAAGWTCYPSLLGLWADRLYAQANLAEDAEVPGLIDQLAGLGTPAIPRLTAALGSERKVVAQAVRKQLLQSVENWEHPDTRPNPEERLTLAISLASRVRQYGPSARNHAKTLARRMLDASTDGLSKSEASQLVLACEMILNSSKQEQESSTLAEQGASSNSQAAMPETEYSDMAEHRSATKRNETENHKPLSDQSLVELARFPGGGLNPALPELRSRRLAPEEGGGHSIVPLDRSAKSPNSSLQGKRETSGDLAEVPLSKEVASNKEPALQRLPENPALRPMEAPEDGATAITSPRYGSINPSTEKPSDRVYALILQLRSTDQQQADQARRELNLGGFKTIHFALAERLTDPDPMVRKELAQVLPRLKSVQAESWLKWLLKDDDPNVRREAITTLASSKDPLLLAEIAHLAQSDTDPKVRLEGQRIERRLGQ